MKKSVKLNDPTQVRLAVDEVQRLTAQTSLGISATALISIILAAALIGVLPLENVMIWLSASLSLSLARILTHLKYRRQPLIPGNVDRRKRTYLFLLALSGCMWGAVPVFLYPSGSIPHQVVIALVLGGMVAGSVAVFATIMATFYAISIPTILPLIIVFLIDGDGLHVAMGSILIIFAFFMFTAAKRLNREIHNFLLRKYENVDLIESLEKEIRERENAETELKLKNQGIESIVSERTGELRQLNKKLLIEIDDRIEAEKALRQSEEKFRELANSLPQIVFETNGQGTITFANRNMFELLGYSKDDFDKGISAFQILTTDNPGNAKDSCRSFFSEEKLEGYECLARTKDGATFPVAVHSTPVFQSDRSAGMRGIIIDLTEKKRIEEEQKKLETQLQRAQKMELLATTAGGVAHDLNNILSGIVSYPDLLLMQIPPDSSLHRPIQVMQESGKKAAAIVQDLLTLTRRGVVVEEVLNLNDVVREYLDSPEFGRLSYFHPKVKINFVLDENLLDIVGSSVHLTKTLMNLVSNAAEAMPDGGLVRIVTTNRYLDQPVQGYDDIKKGDYVVLSVSDEGTGIAPDDIDRIFEPFFTKKVMGRSGTGLGMAVVWGTVKDHKGYIDINSVEGRGSKFSLYFPVTRKQRSGLNHQEPIMTYFGNGEAVLLVDDMQEQRQIVSEMLTQMGYQVEAVSSGEAAVAYMKQNKADVIVLDMIMDPGMDGLDTYKKILKFHPAQKAVIASGFSETGRVKEALRLGAGPYIKKPYTWINLGQAVKEALNRRGRSEASGPLSPSL